MGFSELIRALRKQQHLTLEEVGNVVGVGKSTVRKWESGEIANMRRDKIALLAKALNVSPSYLMGWETGDSPLLPAGNLRNVTKYQVPLLGSIAAGTPILAEESYDMYVDSNSDIHCDYALRVDGDSMEPTIRKGDIVFIRAQDDVIDGEIAAVLLDDSATLKRVYHIKDGLQLLSDNASMYPPMICTMPDTTTIRILGKAVSFTRKI